MSKIRVIDLLNKIANEELPFEQEFKYDGVITDIEMFSNEYLLNEAVLNFEIELVELKEEDKEIEEIKINLNSTRLFTEQIEDKLNELIRELNELKKGK